MKKLIIAGLLAATLTSAQAARFRLSEEPIAIGKGVKVYAVVGSVMHDDEWILMKVKSISTDGKIDDFHTISIDHRQCASGIVRLHWHDVQTDKVLTRKDHGIGDGTVGGQLVRVLCYFADRLNGTSTDQL